MFPAFRKKKSELIDLHILTEIWEKLFPMNKKLSSESRYLVKKQKTGTSILILIVKQ